MSTILTEILSTLDANTFTTDTDADSVQKGLHAFFLLLQKGHIASTQDNTDNHLTYVTPSPAFVDYLISSIDSILSEQINTIIHHPQFLALECTWRSLFFLTTRIDFEQNIRLEYINVSKQDLLQDFQDSPEVTHSGLYKHIYTEEFGQFGGIPVGIIVADYSFAHHAQDIQLLQYMASVASMAHAPILAAADKTFFAIDSWSLLPDITNIASIFENAAYRRWNSFREHPYARYIGLTLPGFLLRVPYDSYNQSTSFAFHFTEETNDENDFCWGNTAFALAANMADSFAKYRWCVNIVGTEGGGRMENLPKNYHHAMQGIQSKISTRAIITEQREFALAELGFISLAVNKTPYELVFFSANSVLKSKKYPKTKEGVQEEISFRLSTQLPYIMLINRLAHYIKILQRENMGTWQKKEELTQGLNTWINQYVTAMDTPDAHTRSRRPLRMAKIYVTEIEGQTGWYAITLLVRPHFKYMGVNFTLSLEGRLERPNTQQNIT